MADPIKQDGSTTGLRYAEEDSYGVVSGDEIWVKLEPNSYESFGPTIATTPRNPIVADRQNQKGVVSDVDAAGAFENDLTQSTNITDLFQGYFFADYDETGKTLPRNDTQVVLTSTTTSTYAAASGLDGIGLLADHLILAEDFIDAANNGLKTVTIVSGTAITVEETLVVDASPAATARLTTVGYQFEATTVDVVMTGSLPAISRVSGAVDFTTLGLEPGDWIWVGGDVALEAFDGANNAGWARISTIVATDIFLDITDSTWTNETPNASATVQIFFGNTLNNDPLGVEGANFNRRTYQLERTLGADDTAMPAQLQSEYLTGSVPNEMTMNIPATSKVTMDLGFISKDHETRDGATGEKAGTRPTLADVAAFGTTGDVNRIKLNVVDGLDSNPAALFSFIQELSININNNVEPNKAVSVLGAFEVSTGQFGVSGSLTAYFTKNSALDSIRNNDSIAVNAQLARDNKGLVVDIPNATLAGGPPSVELNAPITLPLTFDAFKDSTLGYTMSMQEFEYLPTVAM